MRTPDMHPNSDFISTRLPLFMLVIVVLTWLTGWVIPLMEVDAVQYANMSREMLQTGNYLQVYDRGEDYLDKPPMLFWLSALSMKLFGVNHAAYRLPSFCFAVLAVYSCFKLARLYYEPGIAWLSALVLAICQAMFLINHDVRTDTMLMGWVIAATWQLAAWYQTDRWKHLLLASVALAGGMLTKGPVAVIVPALAFVPHFVLHRQWKQFFRWQYLVITSIVLLLLTPALVGFYQQFDLQPEKVMYGQKGTSGVRFFLWTQSFGRITGESTWHEYDTFYFLYQNMLWSFLPWIIFFSIALAVEVYALFKKRFRLTHNEEWISTGGFIFTYAALASSRAQLPHYIFIAFPFAAIITGKFLYQLLYTDAFPQMRLLLSRFHYGLYCLLLLALLVLLFVPFASINKMAVVLCIIGYVVMVVVLNRKYSQYPLFLRWTLFTMVGINLHLNIFLYPALLSYQPGVAINRFLKAKNIPPQQVVAYNFPPYRSLDFYGRHHYRSVATLDSVETGSYVITPAAVWDTLNKQPHQRVYRGEKFHVSMLTLKFLNPRTRHKETEPYYLFRKTSVVATK